ncbi:hypothetical protein SAMN05216262_1394 [Colwellia chukchiensis]|uniref:Uncharacterized protein n=1 Tax=Colwellia chukchiensis TaxID=641665 RepID=A0A1H7UE52_9GAMM|nr:hypothetical protein [Colwellia chukchiensis]SEL94918.1 hypothetical protein SAMN05216262_1394 [Colwellia chukchiensis]
MFRLFKWFKIVVITVLLTQHGFAATKPMNCEEHHKDSSDTHIMQPSKNMHHQTMDSNSHHHAENSKDAKHNHADEECEKCKAGDCLCCEGGFCASFHLNAYLVQEEEESNSNINLDLIIQRIPPPASGIHLLPYRPPIIG